jgi:hypothetical protein
MERKPKDGCGFKNPWALFVQALPLIDQLCGHE